MQIIYKINDWRHKMTAKVISAKNIRYFLRGGAMFSDITSVQMNGKCLISLGRKADIKIGENFILNSGKYCIDNLACSKIAIGDGASFSVGDNSGFSNIVIQCLQEIRIGNFVNVGAGCMLMDSDFHSLDWRKRADRKIDSGNAKTAPILIGDYVFIGARSIVLKGVTIGERAIISAGSVVVSDIPPDCIAGGNPCKVIRFLNND